MNISVRIEDYSTNHGRIWGKKLHNQVELNGWLEFNCSRVGDRIGLGLNKSFYNLCTGPNILNTELE